MSAPNAPLSELELLTRVFATPESLAVITRLRDSIVIGISPGFSAQFGIEPADVVGRTALEAGLWRDAAQRAGVINMFVQRGSITGEAVSIRGHDGRQYDALMSCALIEHAGERYLFSLIQEVRHYATEAEARTREIDSLRTLILESEVGVYRRRGPPHGLIDANPALAQMLGHGSAQALIAADSGRSAFDYLDPGHAERMQALLRSHGRYAHQRAEVRRADAGTTWVSESARAVYSGDGILLHVDGTLVDISVEVRAAQALEQSETLYRKLVENSRDGVFLMQHGRVVYANDALATILDQPVENLIGASYFDWVAPEDLAPQTQRKQARESGSRDTQDYEIRLLRRDGGRRLCTVRAGAVEFRGELASIGTLRDITEERAKQQRLEAAEERYRLLFKHAVLGMFRSTAGGELIEANDALAAMFGFDTAEAMHSGTRNMRDFYVNPEMRQRALDVLSREGLIVGWEFELMRRDGARFWGLSSVRVVQRGDAGQVQLEGSLIDISSRRAAEQELKFLAHHDSLTGLGNRRQFERRLAAMLDRLRGRGDGPFAVLLLGLDRFKLVNDSLGHAAGDELLAKFAARLTAVFGQRMDLARYGGDQFALLSRARVDRDGAIEIARRVEELARAPFQVRGHQVFCGASIGIVLVEQGDALAEAILRDADTAMFSAKSRGAGFALFDQHMHASARERLALETDLRFALVRGELIPMFQPIVSMSAQRIVGVEALVRWQHPQRGLLLPAQFLAVAEETGLLPAIDLLVLEQSLAQLAKWQADHGERAPDRLSVNISDRLFAAVDFPQTLQRLLAHSGVDPARVHLEITETVFRADGGSLRATLAALKAIGIRLVVDDFGTGYSSLVSFSEAAFDGLKVDRGFVQDLESNPRHRAIVRTIAQFALDLGLSLVAEGVETETQAQILRQLGCDLVQGYLIAAALPASVLGTWFADPTSARRLPTAAGG
jgi:diguanylate cyclase (GGDEF)-like protein/PAS domain S-box-containing protein